MNNLEISQELKSLIQLDIDAVAAYDHAISALGHESHVAHDLAGFKLDHQRHIVELSKALLDMGVNPPEASPDLKGTILGGVTAVRSRLGTEQALLAMKSNEQLTTSSYATAVAKPFPDDVLELVRRGYADEQRHLAWIEKAIDTRIWEGASASAH